MNEHSNHSEQNELFNEINKHIGEQVSRELDKIDTSKCKTVRPPRKKRIPLWAKIMVSTCCILLSFIIVGGCLLYRGVFGNIKRPDSNIHLIPERDDVDEEDGNSNGDYKQLDSNSIQWIQNYGDAKKVEGVINILLLGEQIEPGEKRGRTDSIMIATMNTNTKSLKLTTIMRDTYVQIPGYKDNRINTAYRTGDYPLIMETIEHNFNIDIDGFVKVDYDGFEAVIDALGGVEITLTEEEANYLNKTNYIANKKYRTVKPGKQIMNGAQALGYSRIRYVKTGDNLKNDFGRTSRQRIVLETIFNKYKSSSVTEMLEILPKIASLITTDISNSDLTSYAITALGLNVSKLETLRVPVDHGYTPAIVRKMSVLVPDLSVNIDVMHDFIFGTNNEELLSTK